MFHTARDACLRQYYYALYRISNIEGNENSGAKPYVNSDDDFSNLGS